MRLLTIRASNGGKQVKGDIKSVLDEYHSNGFHEANHDNLNYQLRLFSTGHQMLKIGNNKPLIPSVFINESFPTNISPLTDCDGESPTAATAEPFDDHDGIDIDDQAMDVATIRKSISGRKKGSTKQAKKETELNILNAKTAAAECYYEAKQLALLSGKLRTANGLVQKIISAVEEQYCVPSGTISQHTIMSRVMAEN
jgi:uncharacterized protein (UPF0335 family)